MICGLCLRDEPAYRGWKNMHTVDIIIEYTNNKNVCVKCVNSLTYSTIGIDKSIINKLVVKFKKEYSELEKNEYKLFLHRIYSKSEKCREAARIIRLKPENIELKRLYRLTQPYKKQAYYARNYSVAQREQRKEYRDTEHYKNRMKAVRADPKTKAKAKEYRLANKDEINRKGKERRDNMSPSEVLVELEKRKIYRSSKKGKDRTKEYNARPDVKKRKLESAKKNWHNNGGAEKQREYRQRKKDEKARENNKVIESNVICTA